MGIRGGADPGRSPAQAAILCYLPSRDLARYKSMAQWGIPTLALRRL
jgi:hypothetical protein